MAMTTASWPASQVLEMLDRAGGKKLSALYDGLPKTWGSPTMAP